MFSVCDKNDNWFIVEAHLVKVVDDCTQFHILDEDNYIRYISVCLPTSMIKEVNYTDCKKITIPAEYGKIYEM